MRVVTYGAATSLDGFMARLDHSVDWLSWTDEVAELTAAYWKTIDTVVMGRKTYEAAVRGGMNGYPGVHNYVVSRSLAASPDSPITVIRDNPADFIRRLKALPGRGICIMGGGELAAALLETGLIDEIGVNLHPVLLGAGVPFVPALSRRIRLELAAQQRLTNGCCYLLYWVRSE